MSGEYEGVQERGNGLAHGLYEVSTMFHDRTRVHEVVATSYVAHMHKRRCARLSDDEGDAKPDK